MATLQREVLTHLVTLLRIDTSNPGPGEADAADYVVGVLADAGVRAQVLEPEPGRCSVIARHAGREPDLPALVVHGHLDVVPADPSAWTRDPFGGEVVDGVAWGRGAVDMKGMVAAMLTVQRALATGAASSRRDLIFAYFADEEMGSRLGSRWVVEHHPELFTGATEAIGEIGGFRVTLPDGRRLYPLQVGERGMLWARIGVDGPGGHAAFSQVSNPIDRLARLTAQVGELQVGDPPGPRLVGHAHSLGLLPPGARRDEDAARRALAALGSFGDLLAKGVASSFTATAISAGDKVNVIPHRGTLAVDCRFLPGEGDAAMAALRSLLDDDMTLEVLSRTPGAMAPAAGGLLDAAAAALARVDPEGVVVPYTFPASTDGQHLATLGIAPYGFTPLVVDDDRCLLDFFHVPDERVPVVAVERCVTILTDFLEGC